MKRARAEADYRRALAHRLREKSAELEDAIFDRIRALEEDPEQPSRSLESLRPLIRSLSEYGAVAVECGERHCPPPPPAALDHARKAAWVSVPLLRLHERYLAAESVFNRFLRQEASSVDGYAEGALSRIQESNDLVFERLFRVAGEELEREHQKQRRSTATQKVERVRALLAGELLEAPDLEYRFGATHIGLVGRGELTSSVKEVASSVDGGLLLIEVAPHKIWAWIATDQAVTLSEFEEVVLAGCPSSARIGLGEPAAGLTGWRRTHREAQVALEIAARGNTPVARYADVAILAAMVEDDLLWPSLKERYLTPLTEECGGIPLCETLRAYFAADGNKRSAAAALGISRQAVSYRLDRVESVLNRPLSECAGALQTALQLAHFFDYPA